MTDEQVTYWESKTQDLLAELERAQKMVTCWETANAGLIQQVRQLEDKLKQREAECNTLTGEVSRLLSGRFTPQERHNLCHNLKTRDVQDFQAGCFGYQLELFGACRTSEALVHTLYTILTNLSGTLVAVGGIITEDGRRRLAVGIANRLLDAPWLRDQLLEAERDEEGDTSCPQTAQTQTIRPADSAPTPG